MDQSKKLEGRLVASSSSCPFRNFIDQIGWIDLGFAGNPYTWCNNRKGPATIKKRLDRSLASPSWINLHPKFFILHLPAYSSDHNPITLDTAFPSPFLHRPFRFKAFWTKDPSCGLVIGSAWSSSNYVISLTHSLVKKLKKTKFALKKWNSLYFGHIQTKIKSTMSHIDKVQQSPPDPSCLALEAKLKLDLDDLLLKEEILWKSKSRETWLACKDLNTKYFHASTLIKRRSNAVNYLNISEGNWVSNRATIGDNFVSHFSNLFTSSSPPIEEEMLDLFTPIITEEENLLLSSIPSEEEVFKALSSLGSSKAPGPDGFTALFYKKFWSTVKESVLACIGNFFKNDHLLQEQNHTFISLIPKQSGGSHSVNQFRPISLCNIVYKLITKILADRLKSLLPKIISPLQSAFMPNRNIQDNTILAHELLHTFKEKRGKWGLMFLKMDMEKAFDKME